jgi:hypothetical protein
MRIVRREAYNRLRPLPNGLHFTPAMSARALLDREARAKLVEIDMPYHERVGDSKLKAGRDGLRFLGVITKTALMYRPVRLASILLIMGVLTLGVSLIFFVTSKNEPHPSSVQHPTHRNSVSSFASVE